MSKAVRISILTALLAVVAAFPPAAPAAPTATGHGGAAATVDVLATKAATDVLRAGGNAVDAAVAAAAVLGVTEPFSCGIGGGGFMLIRTAGGEVTTIDHRELSPRAMRPDSFTENGRPLPFGAARYSGLSAGVPGTVAGWDTALRKYGTYSLREALAHGIAVARNGFTIDQTFFDQTNSNRDFFDDISSSQALYLDPDGTPRDVGTTFTNPDLAAAYQRIAHLGAKGFYRGAIADAMVTAVKSPPVDSDANHTWRPGLMTMKDLRDYTAPERAPTRVGYRGLEVLGMGPPSSGGSTIGEALNILEGYDLAAMDRDDAFHYFLEASRFSFADRNVYLADPAFFDVPLRGLLSNSYAAERRALISDHAAGGAVAAGDPYPHNGEGNASAARRGRSGDKGTSTTHLTVSDKWGNVVSYTFTIESTGGNGIVVPGWGFLLNNELTDFNYDSTTHPNRADSRKRPRSSMAPTLVQKAGEPLLAVGSPGGATIITTVLQILVDRLDLGSSLPDAIAFPRASQRNLANTTAEPAFISSDLGQTLVGEHGHQFANGGEIGAATAIEFLPGGGVLAAAEPARRGGGTAMTEAP